MNAVTIQRIAHRLHRWRVPLVPRLLKGVTFLLYSSILPPEAEIGAGTRCGYGGIGVVIHPRSRIGRNVVIGTQVTIGGRAGAGDVPVIEDDVYIATGAKILGAITVGRGAVIGANAVVIAPVPPDTVVAGVPARIISQGDKARAINAMHRAAS